MVESKHVVIVGGGFAGLHAARALGGADFRVTLLDKRNFQLFQPLLYQVATGSLPPGDIATPLRAMLRDQHNVRVIQATALDLDPRQRLLRHERGEERYDTLIVATGVKHHYFGKDEWQPLAPGLKTVEHALEIRHRVFEAFELAEVARDEAECAELMTFAIVGGGPTGVELAGAIGELAHKTLVRDFRSIDPRRTRIVLIEGAAEVLPAYPPKLRAAARRSLEALGVTVMTGARVEHLAPDAGSPCDTRVVSVRCGERTETLRAGTVLWAAGVRASTFGEVLAQRTGAVVDRAGRLRVDGDGALPQQPEIFVIGDLAQRMDARGREVPGLAQGAIQQGRHVARLLRARARHRAAAPFVYRDYGSMAVIGMNHAVGDLRWIKVSGVSGWLIWAFVHILSLVDGRQRLRVFVQWSWKYFARRQGDRLITGHPPKTRELRERFSKAA